MRNMLLRGKSICRELIGRLYEYVWVVGKMCGGWMRLTFKRGENILRVLLLRQGKKVYKYLGLKC